ncbi:MAG: AAA family ATPase [Symploca sp. SIO2E9]|nr:AAA family ATPase [Symploca sp. SIO2E9]
MFSKATKSTIKIRLAISGASGSGKTYSALAIASHLGSSIAVIDTEHGSASRYADRFDFDSCQLNNHHPAKYIEAIKAAENAGYQVIIIDSLSHAWYAEVDLAGKGFDGWKNVRPLERKLIDSMLGSKAHVIATMRSKTEWVMEDYKAKDGKIKQAPKKIGTAPVQSSGIEYEFDVAGEMNYDHILNISKSRCPELTDLTFLNPGKEVADILKVWINPNPWANWKTEDDALIWAAKQLEGLISSEEIKAEWETLEAQNGKKAPAWVARIEELKGF